VPWTEIKERVKEAVATVNKRDVDSVNKILQAVADEFRLSIKYIRADDHNAVTIAPKTSTNKARNAKALQEVTIKQLIPEGEEFAGVLSTQVKSTIALNVSFTAYIF